MMSASGAATLAPLVPEACTSEMQEHDDQHHREYDEGDDVQPRRRAARRGRRRRRQADGCRRGGLTLEICADGIRVRPNGL